MKMKKKKKSGERRMNLLKDKNNKKFTMKQKRR